LNCALFLGFTLVVGFSCLQFGERLSAWHRLGLGLAVASVMFGALQGGERERALPPTLKNRLAYAAILASVFVLNPGMSLVIKYLAMRSDDDGGPLLARHGSVFFACAARWCRYSCSPNLGPGPGG
jgi:drug/metabolite transporter (DMT)-like permease